MIYEYTSKLFSNGFGKKSCCHWRVNPTWQCEQYSSVSNLLADLCNCILNKSIHLPVARTFTYIFYKVVDHLCSFYCMKYFWMELDCIQFLSCVLSCCNRTVSSVCCNFKSRSNLWNIIKMAHPTCCCLWNTLKYFGVFFINNNFCLTVFSYISTLNFSTKYMWHQLCTITQSENRNTKLEQFFWISRWIRLITAVRSACENDSFRIHCFDLFNICLIRINLAIYITFPDTSGNQLIILSTKVKDNH